jgi:predicted phage terminase large subunit-like protein
MLLPPVRDRDGVEYPCKIMPAKFDGFLQSWDTSFKDEAESIRKGRDPDPVSGGCWARSGPDAYLMDRRNERLDIVGAVEAIRQMSADWPEAITKLIEDKANGPAIRAILRRELPGLIPVTPQGSKISRVMTAAGTEKDKDARAMAMVDLFHAGNVYLPHPAIAPWVWEYIEQLVTFPNGAHDDDVDMTSQALMHMQTKVWMEADKAEAFARSMGGPAPKNLWDKLKRDTEEGLRREREGEPVTPNRWRMRR